MSRSGGRSGGRRLRTRMPPRAGSDAAVDFVAPQDPDLCVASTEYGTRFSCALAGGNVFACQFHPEKSAADGLRMLRNFLSWNGTC